MRITYSTQQNYKIINIIYTRKPLQITTLVWLPTPGRVRAGVSPKSRLPCAAPLVPTAAQTRSAAGNAHARAQCGWQRAQSDAPGFVRAAAAAELCFGGLLRAREADADARLRPRKIGKSQRLLDEFLFDTAS